MSCIDIETKSDFMQPTCNVKYELMTVVFNMTLIPQCRASGQETRARTTLVLQSRVENGIQCGPGSRYIDELIKRACFKSVRDF